MIHKNNKIVETALTITQESNSEQLLFKINDIKSELENLNYEYNNTIQPQIINLEINDIEAKHSLKQGSFQFVFKKKDEDWFFVMSDNKLTFLWKGEQGNYQGWEHFINNIVNPILKLNFLKQLENNTKYIQVHYINRIPITEGSQNVSDIIKSAIKPNLIDHAAHEWVQNQDAVYIIGDIKKPKAELRISSRYLIYDNKRFIDIIPVSILYKNNAKDLSFQNCLSLAHDYANTMFFSHVTENFIENIK